MTTRLLLFSILAVFVLVTGASADVTAYYHAIMWNVNGSYTDLGTLPDGTDSRAYSINRYGQITGWATNASGVRDAVRWDSTGIVDLGLGSGYSINAFGQVAGESNGEAVMWDANGTAHDIGPGIAYGINDNGQVAGGLTVTTQFGTIQTHAFVWSLNGGLIDLGKPDGTLSATARAINAYGSIAGVSAVNSDYAEAFVKAPGGDWTVVDDGIAMAVNDAGQVTGNSLLSQGFIWGSVAGPADISMTANGLNQAGDIAGTSPASNAAFWTANNDVTELTSPDGSIRSVGYGIDDYGHVVGWAMYVTPEPSSIAALLVGFVGLIPLGLTRRRL